MIIISEALLEDILEALSELVGHELANKEHELKRYRQRYEDAVELFKKLKKLKEGE